MTARPGFRVSLCLAVALLFIPLTSQAQGFYAGQISEKNLQRLPPGGLDAIGGRDDWFMTDGELCAVVSAKAHTTYLSLRGGVLVDLWHCERGNDQWSTAHAQHNLQKEQIPPIDNIRAGYSERQSWIETVARLSGVENRTRYTFDLDNPGQVNVHTSIERKAQGDAFTALGNSFLHPRGSLIPFTLDTIVRENSRGFDQPYIDTADRAAILAAVSTANLQVLLGSRHVQPSISYGINVLGANFYEEGEEPSALNTFMMGGEDFTMFGAFSGSLPQWWSATPGIMSFMVSQLFDLDTGERFTFDMAILVGSRADAAAITDRLYQGPQISGSLDTAEASITVRDSAGASLTFVRPDTSGSFSFRVPAGIDAAQLHIKTPWSNTSRTIEVGDQPVDLGLVPTGARGTVLLPRGTPMSLLFESVVKAPVFFDELTGRTVGGDRVLSGAESHRLSLTGTASDPTTITLAPGTYNILASRGLEYGVNAATLAVRAGETSVLTIVAPQLEVDSSGLISADFHVHSGIGFDSSLAPRQRIADFIAQGGELLVATEHNITYDLQPTIDAMGLGGQIVGLAGVELTGMIRTEHVATTIGHNNVFPLVADPQAFMGGTLPFEDLRLGQVIGAYKSRFPHSIVQLNHPREAAYDDDLAFFNHLSTGNTFAPDRNLTEGPNLSLLETLPDTQYRDIDFDALELLSGEAMDEYETIRRDWFSLLRQGIYKIVTANSDSHASHQLVAYPRTLLFVPDESLQNLTAETVARAVKSGNLYGSTGPILRVDLDGTPPGSTFTGSQATLSIRTDSASWVDVDEARIWINGELAMTLPLDVNGNASTAIAVTQDSYIFVEVAGTASALYSRVVPGLQPFAFANPVFLDVAGDGWHSGEH